MAFSLASKLLPRTVFTRRTRQCKSPSSGLHVYSRRYNDDALVHDHHVSRLNDIYYNNHVDVHSLRYWMEDKWGKSYDVEFYQQNPNTWVFEVKTTYLGQEDFRFQTCEAYENYLIGLCASLNDLELAQALENEIKRCKHAPYIVLGRWKHSMKILLNPRNQRNLI